MEAFKIKSFSVYGLFGTDDVNIPFNENVKILIGENGLGKTQVLNLLYYTLTRNFLRLAEYNFHEIILEFYDKRPIAITKEQINYFTKTVFGDPLINDFIEEFGHAQFEVLRKKYISSKGNIRKFEESFAYNSMVRKYPVHRIFRVFEELYNSKAGKLNNLFTPFDNQIKECVTGFELLYFPTYRRVEEDLFNLGYEDDFLDEEDTLIQFGMEDVKKRFNQIEQTIDQFLKEGFSKITSEILSHLVKGFADIDKGFIDRINQNDIEIILARVGNQLPESDKNEIKNIVLKKEVKNNSLTYFLQALVEIYEKQKELDDSVKKFRDICNKYLVNKKIFYDESAIKIYVKSDKNAKEIELGKLSSGEKQLLSMFSKIYLSETSKRFIVLFDEPELSLSMIWQKMLLPHIINSGKCDFLFAVTHSPFIFDNELDKYAVGLNEYIEPSKTIVV